MSYDKYFSSEGMTAASLQWNYDDDDDDVDFKKEV